MAETWVLNETGRISVVTYTAAFTSNGTSFSTIQGSSRIRYGSTIVTNVLELALEGGDAVYEWSGPGSFVDQAYRTLTFDTAPTGDLLTWLQANGVKQQSKPTNKVIVNGETILDLTQDTVTPATLAKGITAHDKSGAPITGAMEASAGGDYNIAATTNSDGTQNLAITDAGGGSSGGSGVTWYDFA